VLEVPLADAEPPAPVWAPVDSPPVLMGIRRLRAFSCESGTVTSSMPFVKRACACSSCASSGSGMTLRKYP